MANIQRRFLKARTFVLIVTGVWMTSEVFAQTTYVESWGNDIYGQCDTPAGLSNVLAVAGGNDFSLALKSDHTVVAWGNNNMGQCNLPAGLSNVTAIAAAMGSFGLALKSDGTVVGWGSNGLGQVTIPAGLSNVVAIAAGNVQSLAVKSDGTVVAWGGNSFGETNVPAGLSNVIAVCGYQNSMALKSDGSIMAWGFNGRGENNIPGGLGPVTAIATRQHTLVLKQDGTVAAWGLNDWGEATVPGGVGNVVAIGAGYSHNLVLESNGTLVAWGYNANGQGSVPAGLTGVSAIGVGGNHNLVVTTVPLIKISAQPQSMLTNVGAAVTFQISATCQLPLSYQWQKNGTNLSGATTSALSIPTTQASDAGNYAMVLSHPTATVTSSIATLSFTPPKIITQPKNAVVQVGNSVSFSVSATGSLPLNYQWRKNGTDLAGQTATNLVIAGVQQSDAGTYAVFVSNGFGSVTSAPAVLSIFQSQQNAVSPPSTVVSLGGPTPPAGLNDVIAIAAGFGQQLAVHSNGTVTCWGSTFLGSSPQPPAGLSNVVAVASCGIHSIALKSDGTVVGWGQSSTPPAGLSNVVAISSGHDHSVALKADGTAVAWGGVSVGPPLHNSNLVAIAAGNSYTIGLCNDGTVPPSTSTLAGFTGASNMMAIAGGGFNSFLMLSNNGTVVGWNVTIPAGLSNVVALSPGLALKSDSTVVALGSATSSVSMTNVTAISGGVGNGLVLTRWPVVIQTPQSQTVNAGTNAFFTVTAAGAGSLSYQWRKAGTNIDGATASSLSISNVTAADASSYDVLVSNSNGSVASVPATLTVNLAPIITAPPQSQTVRA